MAEYRINVPDGVVGVDGVFRKVNMDDIDPEIHAVVWDDTKGFVEYTALGDVPIHSFAEFQKFIDRWALQDPLPPAPLTGFDEADAELAMLYKAAVAEVEAARIKALVESEGTRLNGPPGAVAYVRAAAQLAKEKAK